MNTIFDNNEMIDESYLNDDKKQENAPLLFKFKSLSTSLDVIRFIKIIKEYSIYLPTVEELNDSLEGLGTHIIEGKQKNKLRVLSLSSSCFSPVMWSHYGANRSGVCIGFFKGNSFDTCNYHIFNEAEEVIYCKNRRMFSADADFSAKDDLLHKNVDWAYEREWRIIKDYNEKYYKFKNNDIACIIFGEKIDSEIKTYISSICENYTLYDINFSEENYCYYVRTNIGEEIYTFSALYKDLKK